MTPRKARPGMVSVSPSGMVVPSDREFAYAEGFIYKRSTRGGMEVWCSAAGIRAPQTMVALLNGRYRNNSITNKHQRFAADSAKEIDNAQTQ